MTGMGDDEGKPRRRAAPAPDDVQEGPAVKLLCTADVHLGRPPSRIPDGIDPAGLTPAATWHRTVRYAIQEEVDAVLIAGDVVERDDDFYGAYPDLLDGATRLAQAGIETLAVAGNHDRHVLPRLARAVPQVRLLGAGGAWEIHELRGRDGTIVDVAGWSFPEDVVRTSPLTTFPVRESARACVGLLHGDRDASASRYAPFASADLRALPVDAWLLGHVHAPDFGRGGAPSGYLGSLVGTDPGEPGPHGPWLLEVSPKGAIDATHVPLAPLRWSELDVDVSGLQDPEDVAEEIAAAIATLHQELLDEPHRPDVVGLRVRLTGRHARVDAIRSTLGNDDPTRAVVQHDDIRYFAHRSHLEIAPVRDLEALARTDVPAERRVLDPVGLLAKEILILRGPDGDEKRALVQAALERFERERAKRPFTGVRAELPDEAGAVRILERAALHALERLLAQDPVST